MKNPSHCSESFTILFVDLLAQLAVIVAILAGGGYWLAVTNEGFLQAICEGIPGSFTINFGFRRNICRFRGRFAGRDLLVEYRFRLLARERRLPDELEIHVPVIQKFWLRLITRSPNFPIEEELFSEEEVPGSPFLAHSNQPEAARQFLETPEILEQMAKLGAVTRLEIYRGTLKALYQKSPDHLYRSTFQDTLEAIVRIVDVYERQLALKLIPVRVNQSCPYCRERLNPETETVVLCSQCVTRVHQACWNENRHCTTWGCSSIVAKPG